MDRWASSLSAVLVLLVTCSLPAQESAREPDSQPDATQAAFFREHIQPLLAEHCYECHSQKSDKIEGDLRLDDGLMALQGGRSGVAIRPGDASQSLLIEAVSWSNDNLQMPPQGRLGESQLADLRTWIQTGAYWPEASSDRPVRLNGARDKTLGQSTDVEVKIAADRSDKGTASRADVKSHWAWQPIQAPRVTIKQQPIDAFIEMRLSAEGLTPNPPAEPRVLLRRLYLDLIGLPPTPYDLDCYESDTAPDRYERLVDRLLASPQYGERWARHWLDVVRYTESNGFEYDRMRDHAWPYRDYVIRSFNADRPYDEFMRQQIAGDVLEPITADSTIATSLLVCGPFDQAGSNQANLVQRATTREEEMEDLVSCVSQTFLGLTVNCARCHDHKFDPISQIEYYRFKSVFDGVKHGDRSLEGLPRDPRSVTPVITYSGTRVQPPPTAWLRRGNVRTPADIVSPAGLSLMAATEHDFSLAADAPEAERRKRFAHWLTDPRNPLPARVIVNRVWQYHFGVPLVATPSDLGISGALPSHPELVDWLAAELIRQGWSLKRLHRTIVGSDTYRRSATYRPEAAQRDAENRLLWRFPPRRLEAEVVRDAMLLVSGSLNSQMHGPSVRPFTTTDFNATFYHPFDRDAAEFNRRTIYRMNVNSGKDPLLDVFDCPDPSIKTPRRNATITPLQALALMNGSFVQRQAHYLAKRCDYSAPDSAESAIRMAYRHALLRDPMANELERSAQHVKAYGLESLCWALLNSTEFLYVQ